ncbi:dual specificity protein phosphatase family protein [[Phormidium] sp. ETS-05]|uniref:dual specificity protein phosphatase family protein n=1 Tax=[Phormidium] sp. ETS-05 TaxID=222819 RepID=UPI0018EF1AAA|nr:dual specificity protein phosphatase family protein [[Phormidium] sp. ETS-05]
MKYIWIFGLSGAFFLSMGIILGEKGWLFCWPGISLLTLAAAYLGLGAKVFGKGEKGKMSPIAVILFLPYLLIYWLIWHLERLFAGEDCYNEIVPGIWVGRRAYAEELPDNINLIVDLTAEFNEPQDVIMKGKNYICLPTLDAAVPSEDELRELVTKLVNWEGNIYIHCAIGHGRSAMVAAAVLVGRGLAENGAVAEAMLKQARPWVKLNSVQRHLVEKVS